MKLCSRDAITDGKKEAEREKTERKKVRKKEQDRETKKRFLMLRNEVYLFNMAGFTRGPHV